MSLIVIPNTFAPGTTAKSAEVNANFVAIRDAFNNTAVQTDIAKTITVAHTFSVAQVFTLQQAFAGGLTTAGASVFGADVSATDALWDLGKSGAGRFRDAFFSRNLVVGGTLGVTGISTFVDTARFQGASNPASGQSVEITADTIRRYDRTGGAYLALTIDALSLFLNANGGGRAAIGAGSFQTLSVSYSHLIRMDTDSTYALAVSNNNGTNPYRLHIAHNNAITNDTAHSFIYAADGSAQRFGVRSNGGVANYSANNVNLSDERLKRDIRALESQWKKHLQLRVVRGKFVDQTHDDDNYMGIAQNVGEVYPELMDDTNKKRLGIYETDLNWITRGVVQECQQRIEKLERRLKKAA